LRCDQKQLYITSCREWPDDFLIAPVPERGTLDQQVN
jgi:hypothetical protein